MMAAGLCYRAGPGPGCDFLRPSSGLGSENTMHSTKLLDAVTAVGATLKSVGEKVGDASLSTSLLSEIRSNFEETFEIRLATAVLYVIVSIFVTFQAIVQFHISRISVMFCFQF